MKGKRIVLCVTGSVAAVQSQEIARELMRHGAEVLPVMSHMAQKIIHPYLLEWATGNQVVTELTGKIEHIAVTESGKNKADLILVAPATANTISKIACGIDDTPVTSVVSAGFGSGIPIVVVPAMHESMYRHSILLSNIEKLKGLGVQFLEPKLEEGKAKIPATGEIFEAVTQKLTGRKDFAGMKLLVTAGPTQEHIDPIRIMTNRSSGKMGIAIAEEALSRGAEVTLIYGPGAVQPPKHAKTINVETTEEMYRAVVSELSSRKYDILIAAAAGADWTLEKPYGYKVSTSDMSELSLKLRPTPKIIDSVKKTSPNTFLVPFKAEYNLSDDELIESAYKRLKTAGADLIVVNDVARKGVGFRVDTDEVFVVDKERKATHIPLASKAHVARELLNIILNKMRTK